MNSQSVVALVVLALVLGGIWLGMQAGRRHIDAVMNAWLGHSAQELVEVWGPPSRIVAALPGAEGSLYIYEASDNTVMVNAPGSEPGKAASVSCFTVSSSSGFA